MPADPIIPAFERNQWTYDTPSTSNNTGRSFTFGNEDHVPRPFESERLPVSLAPEIQRFLRVANLIEQREPRAAYLCKLSFSIIYWQKELFLWTENMLDGMSLSVQGSKFSGRLYVLIIAQSMDRNSEGRGVRQFKTSLLNRLQQVLHLLQELNTNQKL